ncbi:hypothetical protein SLE2022_158610 [Rubroshorea leprosula]
MYNGIGLQTPRGSGTNGYTQSNKFFVKPKVNKVTENTRGFEPGQGTAGLTKKPNRDILEHDRKRQTELKLVVLEDKLTEQGYTDAEIAEKLLEARKVLEAAAASDEITVLSENRTETQTHQVAARKEKQMETLRAALGISSSELNQQIDEGEGTGDVPRIGQRSDDEKPREKREHAFLDRDARWKKRSDDDSESGKEDKKKGAKNVKSKRNKEEANEFDDPRKWKKQEKRRIDDDASDSSDTDDNREHARGTLKKNQKGQRNDSESDTDVDTGKKNRKTKSTKKHNRSGRHDTDDSDSASDDAAVKVAGKKDVHRQKRSHRKRNLDSDDNSSLDGRSSRQKTKSTEGHRVSRRHDSADSDSASDHDGTIKVSSKKDAGKSKRAHGRHDSDDSSSNDEELSMHKNQKGSHHERTRRQQDFKDDSDKDGWREKKSSEVRRHKGEHTGGRRGEQDDLDGGSDRARKNKDMIKRGQGTDDSDSDRGTYTKGKKVTENGKRKLDDGFIDQQPESKSRTRNIRKDVEYKRNKLEDAKFDTESSRAYRERDDSRRDDFSRPIKSRTDHDGENGGREGRIHSKDNGTESENRWDRDYEDRRGSRRHGRDEEEHRGRKRIRDEVELEDRGHKKDDEPQYGSSRRERRWEEEERRSKGHERDRQLDYSKRARRDDFESSEGKFHGYDRSDDRRSRR